MILNISGRSDICAFYTEWLIERFRSGFVDVRNCYYPDQIKRIILQKKNIEAIVFCTKNPIPIFKNINFFSDYPLIFQITITPYQKDIEPNIIDKSKIIECFQQLSKKVGKEFTILRYDPILLNSKYTIDYHKRAFETLCRKLSSYTNRCIISFIDNYKNVLSHQKELNLTPITKETMLEIARCFYKIATKYHITLQTCAEEVDFTSIGFLNEPCISSSLIEKRIGYQVSAKKTNKRKHCHCIETVDIGAYNSCPHFCKYCYANYQEDKVIDNYHSHNPSSSLLIGELTKKDSIKIKEETSKEKQLSLPL